MKRLGLLCVAHLLTDTRQEDTHHVNVRSCKIIFRNFKLIIKINFISQLDFDLCHTIAEAIQVYEMQPNSQSQLHILDDQEVNRPVLELTGKAKISFPCRSFFPLLCLYMKATGSFFSIKETYQKYCWND